jgi:hypothetical protein
MSVLRNLFHRVTGSGSGRFDRYYGDVVRAGVGYPTADEARRDMLQLDRTLNQYSWVR